MSHTDLGQPDLAAPRSAAGNAEFAEVEAQLLESCGYRLGGADPLAPLALDVARSFTEAGLTLHHCATYYPLYRLGGVCLLAVPPEAGTGPGGISASWTTQLRLLRTSRLVSRTREGRIAYYSLADEHVRHVLSDALQHAAEDRTSSAGVPA